MEHLTEQMISIIDFLENEFFKKLMEMDEPIVLAAVAMIMEEYALRNNRDMLEMVDNLNIAAKEVNAELGKYGYEEDK